MAAPLAPYDPNAPTRPSARFPASFFLDPNFFESLPSHTFVSSSLPQESQIKSCLGADIDGVCLRYFSTVHTWLPMLSRKRLLNILKIPASSLEESQSLLLLCMKLASGVNHDGGTARESPLYRLAKSSSTASEHGGFLSLRLVQCLILIAAYELGHAVFPEAYMTIGQASRLGGLLGLHNKELAQQLFTAADTWTLREEQRRTWWAIFVFDKYVVREDAFIQRSYGITHTSSRYVNIGTQFLPHSVQEPCLDILLPVDDIDWNEGVISASEPLLTFSFHSTSYLGSFARTCQASHMLSKVLKHRDHRRHTEKDREEVLTEAIALHGALLALETSLTSASHHGHQSGSGPGSQGASAPLLGSSTNNGSTATRTAHVLALSLIASARMVLYTIYGCNEPETGYARGRISLETEMQRHSIAGTRDLCVRVGPQIASTINPRINELDSQVDDWPGLPSLSPSLSASTVAGEPANSSMLSSVLYQIARECAWLIKEDYALEMYEALNGIVEGLRRLAAEWRVAGKSCSRLYR